MAMLLLLTLGMLIVSASLSLNVIGFLICKKPGLKPGTIFIIGFIFAWLTSLAGLKLITDLYRIIHDQLPK